MNSVTQKISFKNLCLICLLYSAFFTFCLYHNDLGLAYPLFVAGTVGFFIYYMRKMNNSIKRFSIFYIVAICLLGIDICISASYVLAAFNCFFIFILFSMLFLYNIYDDSTWDAGRYFTAIIEFVMTAIGFVFRPFKDFSAACKKESSQEADDNKDADPQQKKNIWYILTGLAISIPLVCVILPLLISSDIIFSNKIDDMFSFVWDIKIGDLIFMFIAGFFMSYAMVYRLTERLPRLDESVADKRNHSPLIAITVNIVLLIIYMMYSGIQIVYLFMRQGELPDGYTYAEYSHEGFFQLVFVCLINIILVLICRKYSKDSLALKIILCLISACTYIMMSSSAYRMFLYISVYCLTFLRIYVLWALLVMAVIMAGIIVYLFRADMPFVKFVLVSFMSLWILFVAIDPDYQIAKYNLINHDDDYYICRLSLDAMPAIERYGDEQILEDYCRDHKYEIRQDMTIRTWNYSKCRAKDIYKKSK